MITPYGWVRLPLTRGGTFSVPTPGDRAGPALHAAAHGAGWMAEDVCSELLGCAGKRRGAGVGDSTGGGLNAARLSGRRGPVGGYIRAPKIRSCPREIERAGGASGSACSAESLARAASSVTLHRGEGPCNVLSLHLLGSVHRHTHNHDRQPLEPPGRWEVRRKPCSVSRCRIDTCSGSRR
jgi:hypothetical protein